MHALLSPLLLQRGWHPAAGNDGGAQPRVVAGEEFGRLADELVHQRYQRDMRDMVGWIAEETRSDRCVEARADGYLAAEIQHRIGEAVEPACLKQRLRLKHMGSCLSNARNVDLVEGLPKKRFQRRGGGF